MKTESTLEILPIPQIGEVFELTFDPAEANPIEMVRRAGYDAAAKWVFNGPEVTGTPTSKFKLVNVGYRPNIDEVNRVLVEQHGPPALGQWREAFKKKYTRSDRRGPIGFTGSEWVSRVFFFPYIDHDDASDPFPFRWTYAELSLRWRFVVEVR